jgi:hypothetical protein
VLNLSAEAAAALAERLRTESVAWVTTVTSGGQPQSKYRAGIAGIGMAPEQLGAEYSTALRITPTRVRVY